MPARGTAANSLSRRSPSTRSSESSIPRPSTDNWTPWSRLSSRSVMTSRPGPKAAISRHSCEPIDPPAPVTRTTRSFRYSPMAAESISTTPRPSRSSRRTERKACEGTSTSVFLGMPSWVPPATVCAESISSKEGSRSSSAPAASACSSTDWTTKGEAVGAARSTTSALKRLQTSARSPMPPSTRTPEMDTRRLCGSSSTRATGRNRLDSSSSIIAMAWRPPFPAPTTTARRRRTCRMRTRRIRWYRMAPYLSKSQPNVVARGAVTATDRGKIAGSLRTEAALRHATRKIATTPRPTSSSWLPQRERRATSRPYVTRYTIAASAMDRPRPSRLTTADRCSYRVVARTTIVTTRMATSRSIRTSAGQRARLDLTGRAGYGDAPPCRCWAGDVEPSSPVTGVLYRTRPRSADSRGASESFLTGGGQDRSL